MSILVRTFDNAELVAQNAALIGGGAFDGNLVLQAGAPVAQFLGASVNQKQTYTVTGTPTTGAQVCYIDNVAFSVPYNCSAVTMATLIGAALAQTASGGSAADITVTGGASPGTPLVVEFKNNRAGLKQNLITIGTSTFDTGTAAWAITTANVKASAFMAWDPTLIPTPTAVLSVADNAAAGTWPAGSYSVSYTWSNSNGETKPSPATVVAVTVNHVLRVAAINAAGTPNEATALNVYVNGLLAKSIAVTTPGVAGNVVQTDITFYDAAVSSVHPPLTNTAYAYTDGRQTCLGLLKHPVSTNAKGEIYFGSSPATGIGGPGRRDAEIIIGGIVAVSLIPGISGNETLLRSQLNGRFIRGAVATGDAVLAFAPFGGQY